MELEEGARRQHGGISSSYIENEVIIMINE